MPLEWSKFGTDGDFLSAAHPDGGTLYSQQHVPWSIFWDRSDGEWVEMRPAEMIAIHRRLAKNGPPMTSEEEAVCRANYQRLLDETPYPHTWSRPTSPRP